MNDAITYPVRVTQSAVYATITDAEDRLVTFISISQKSNQVVKDIVTALNYMHEHGLL